MRNSRAPAGASAILLFCQLTALPAFAQSSPPQANPPYVLSVFATAPAELSVPDSIAVLGDYVFVGYGDGHKPDGSDGKSSQIVQYRMDGSVVYTYTVLGHNDGLKVNPVTHELWALQNEDANPRLVIINFATKQTRSYQFGPTLHGGGYDDIVFRGCRVYLSASNPAPNPNTGPAIVRATLSNSLVTVKPVLSGNAAAIDLLTDATVPLNLQDPDSMTLDALHNLVLDSQADHELKVVSDVGEPDQRVLRLPLSQQTGSGLAAVEADDTAFVTSSKGFILFADKGLNTVFALKRDAFAPGVAYTAANSGPFVGTLDMTTGVITPVVTGVVNPGGLVFVDTSGEQKTPRETTGARMNGDRCRRLVGTGVGVDSSIARRRGSRRPPRLIARC